MKEAFSTKHLDDVVERNLAYGALDLEYELEFELFKEKIKEENRFELEPIIYQHLRDYSNVQHQTMEYIIKKALGSVSEQDIVTYQDMHNITWDRALNNIIYYFMLRTLRAILENRSDQPDPKSVLLGPNGKEIT